MSTLVIILQVVGIFFFLFFYWKSLRDDFDTQKVFLGGFISAILILLGAVAGWFLHADGLWFWGSFLGVILALPILKGKYGIKYLEGLQAIASGWLVWLWWIFLIEGIILTRVRLIGLSMVVLALIILFGQLNSKYRSFGWYKSGKHGFAILVTMGVLFLLKSISSFSNQLTLGSWLGSPSVGQVDIIVSGIAAFVFFAVVYNVARS